MTAAAVPTATCTHCGRDIAAEGGVPVLGPGSVDMVVCEQCIDAAQSWRPTGDAPEPKQPRNTRDDKSLVKRLQKLVERGAKEADRQTAVRWVMREGCARLLEARGYAQDPAERGVAWRAWPGWVQLSEDLVASEPSDELHDAIERAWADVAFDADFDDGTLIGDVYQHLDEGARKAHAFVQTPRFVADFICDETVGNAYDCFPADEVRVIDPACGTGHMMIAALHRMARRHAHAMEPNCWEDADVLAAFYAIAIRAYLYGVDVNPYAVALCKFRLALVYMEMCGATDPNWSVHGAGNVVCADALDKCEQQEGHFPEPNARTIDHGDFERDRDRCRMRDWFRQGFHAIVANPPYIVEPDKAKREYDKRTYQSAYKQYGLGVVFTERMFELGVEGAFVGQITSNAFQKREYGKALIKKVLPKWDTYAVINSSGAYIPGHGTPTVIMFARSQAPGDKVIVLGASKGEPSTPEDPSQGVVWQSILQAWQWVLDRRPGLVPAEGESAPSGVQVRVAESGQAGWVFEVAS